MKKVTKIVLIIIVVIFIIIEALWSKKSDNKKTETSSIEKLATNIPTIEIENKTNNENIKQEQEKNNSEEKSSNKTTSNSNKNTKANNKVSNKTNNKSSNQVTTKANKTSNTTKKSNSNTTKVTGNFDTNEAKKLLTLVNKVRKENGLSEITWSTSLEESAKIRAKEISKSFSHTRPNGNKYSTAINITYKYSGENIAAGQETAEEVFNEWMNSSSHKANILSSNFTQMSVALYKDENSEYQYYWSQILTN